MKLKAGPEGSIESILQCSGIPAKACGISIAVEAAIEDFMNISTKCQFFGLEIFEVFLKDMLIVEVQLIEEFPYTRILLILGIDALFKVKIRKVENMVGKANWVSETASFIQKKEALRYFWEVFAKGVEN